MIAEHKTPAIKQDFRQTSSKWILLYFVMLSWVSYRLPTFRKNLLLHLHSTRNFLEFNSLNKHYTPLQCRFLAFYCIRMMSTCRVEFRNPYQVIQYDTVAHRKPACTSIHAWPTNTRVQGTKIMKSYCLLVDTEHRFLETCLITWRLRH
jgi:hypothetical protein